MNGFFISVEGGDGSGKSTQIRNMEGFLKEKGFDVLLTREPGGTEISEKIRTLLLDPANSSMTAKTEMLLYAAARAQHLEECILPALAEGKVVITDRFTDSSIAYQGYGRGLGDLVREVNDIATDGKKPDMTIYLDIPPAVGMERKKHEEAHELDRMEKEMYDFHERVYEGFMSLHEKEGNRICLLDADRPADEVFQDIKTALSCIFDFEAENN